MVVRLTIMLTNTNNEIFIVFVSALNLRFLQCILSFRLTRQNGNLKFDVHKSSSLACIGAISSTVNHHLYYFLLTQFFHHHIFDPYSTCLSP